MKKYANRKNSLNGGVRVNGTSGSNLNPSKELKQEMNSFVAKLKAKGLI